MMNHQLDNSDPETLGVYKKLMEECIWKCIREDFELEPQPKYVKHFDAANKFGLLENLKHEESINAIAKSLSLKINEDIKDKQLKKHIIALKNKNKGRNKVPAAYMHGIESLTKYLSCGEKSWTAYYKEQKTNLDAGYFSDWELPEKTNPIINKAEHVIVFGNTISNFDFNVVPIKSLVLKAIVFFVLILGISIYADIYSSTTNVHHISPETKVITILNMILYLGAFLYQVYYVKPEILKLVNPQKQIYLLHQSYLGFLISGLVLYLFYLIGPEYLSLINCMNTGFIFIMFAILDTTQIFDKNKIQVSIYKYLNFFLWLSFILCVWDVLGKYFKFEGFSYFPFELGILLVAVLNSVAAMLLFSRMASVYMRVRRFFVILLFMYAALQMKWDTVTTLTASQDYTSDHLRLVLMCSLLLLKAVFLLIVGNNLFNTKNLQNYFEALKSANSNQR